MWYGGVFLDSAIKLYKKTIFINPAFPHSYKNLGIIYLDMKEYELAGEYLKRAEKLGLPVQEYLDKLEMINTETVSKDYEIRDK